MNSVAGNDATPRLRALPIAHPERHLPVRQADTELDTIFKVVRYNFDPEIQAKAIQRAHERFVNEALFLFVVHDVGPRAMTGKVKGFVQAQNWFQNFSSVTVAK